MVLLLIGVDPGTTLGYAILNDKGDFIGRTGMGALMGSKRLKAIVVKGSKKVNVSHQEEYDALRKRLIEKSRDAMVAQSFRSMGTDAGMDLGMMTGGVPIKNWTVGEDLQLSGNLGGPAMTEKYLARNHAALTARLHAKGSLRSRTGLSEPKKVQGPNTKPAAPLEH